MILRDRPSGLKLFFLLRGSIMPRIGWVLLFNLVLAFLLHRYGWVRGGKKAYLASEPVHFLLSAVSNRIRSYPATHRNTYLLRYNMRRRPHV